MDATTLSAEVVPYLTAAAAAYGTAVLDRVEETAADATVSLGQRLLGRLLHRTESRPAVEAAVTELAEDPSDTDSQAALRVELRRLLRTDPALAEELTALLAQAAPNVTVTASGTRSVAAQTISGTVNTGDRARIQR
ncbi:hypothetical protein CFP65_1878 [Kitasatospora sp. MMS16-BH015]|uniref:hypothetical protein n=1 Tax=Kitasatospora sp. MMS16-BH015 TaxID=2018025 RepID=UPI000CA27AD5|nr:hypothetical protein [Kitasatospora sp. MMS16-BH015]AUG76749.1 hypothetical protein CFP65_1878 [Kitasatospora sp. MMS16-BH015]